MNKTINEREFTVREFLSMPIIHIGREKKGDEIIAYYARCMTSIWSPEEPFIWKINAESVDPLLSELNVTAESVWKAREDICFYHDVEWLENMPADVKTPHGYAACIPFSSDKRIAQHRTAINMRTKLPLRKLYLDIFIPASDFREGASLEEIRYKLESIVDDELFSGLWIPMETIEEFRERSSKGFKTLPFD